MFRLSDDRLSFLKIADFWSREIQLSAAELRNVLEAAWWRGELVGVSPPTRLKCLAAMYQMRHKPALMGIVFVTPSDPEPSVVTEVEDGSADVDLRPRLVVPTAMEDWTEDSCAAAFSALAEAPSVQHCPIISPVLCGINVSRDDFFRWARTRGHDIPKFWKPNNATGNSDYRTDDPAQPSDQSSGEPIRDFNLMTRYGTGKIHMSVFAAMEEIWKDHRVPLIGAKEIDRNIKEGLKKRNLRGASYESEIRRILGTKRISRTK